MRLRSLPSALPDLAALGLAVWTVLCHLAVWWGLGLDAVLWASLVVSLAFVAWCWRRRSVPWHWVAQPTEEPEAPTTPDSEAPAGREIAAWVRVAAAALGAWTVVLAYALRQDPVRLFWLGVPLLAVAFLGTRRKRSTGLGSGGPSRGGVLLVLGIALVFLTLSTHRPDADDCFYVNLAVQALDEPTAPLLREDGIYGIEGMPIALPGYRVHSWELLAAGVSRITHIPPILVLHWILPSLAVLLLPFVLARVLRALVPGAWEIALLITLAFLLLDGGGHASFGNYAFVRLQQGKAVLLTVALPLVLACALEYSRRPGRTRALRLWAVQTAAVGLSSSGLFMVPVVAWIALLGSWRGRWDRRLLGGLACSIHPLLLMLALAPAMRASGRTLADVPSLEDPGSDPQSILQHAIDMVLGMGRMRLLTLFLLLSAWAVPRGRHAARVLALFPLVFLALPFDPWFTSFADTPLSREVWFRSFWILPLPIIVGVGLSLPAVRWNRHRGWGALLSLALAVWALGGSVERGTLSPDNETVMDWPPRVKAPPLDYEAARWVVQNTDEGARIVAPERVAIWVPTFVKRTYPMYTRFHYQRYLEQYVDPHEVKVRRTLLGFVSFQGEHLEESQVMCYNSAKFGIDGWVLRNYGSATDQATSEAKVCHFSLVLSNPKYRVWTRRGERAAGP